MGVRRLYRSIYKDDHIEEQSLEMGPLCSIEVSIEEISRHGEDDGNDGNSPSKDTGEDVIDVIVCSHADPISGVVVVMATELRVWELDDEEPLPTGGRLEAFIFQISSI